MVTFVWKCRCGYQRQNMRNQDQPLFTGSASRHNLLALCLWFSACWLIKLVKVNIILFIFGIGFLWVLFPYGCSCMFCGKWSLVCMQMLDYFYIDSIGFEFSKKVGELLHKSKCSLVTKSILIREFDIINLMFLIHQR